MRFIFGSRGTALVALLTLVGMPLAPAAGEKSCVASQVEGPGTSTYLKGVALEDQFAEPHRWAFPDSKPMVLLAADKKGYPALGPWIDAVRARSEGEVSILGVADMRGVPGFLRGKVRRKFAAAEKYPVLLDWDGTILAPLRPVKAVPNAYLISPEGQLLLHLSGPATPAKLEKLQGRLSDLVAINEAIDQADDTEGQGVKFSN